MAVREGARHRLFVAVRSDHRWAAWLENERLAEFHQEGAGEEVRAGDIHLGRVIRVDSGLGAAFVDIGHEQPAFLPLSRLAAPAVQGAKIVVQIEREGWRGKGPRVSPRPALAGARVVFLSGRRGITISERVAERAERLRLSALMKTIIEPREGYAVRTAAVGAQEQDLRREAAALRQSWQDLLLLERSRQPPAILYRQPSIDMRLLRDHGRRFDEIVYDDRGAAAAGATWIQTMLPDLVTRIVFRRSAEWRPEQAEILEQVEEAYRSQVALPSGGSLVIEPTEAMTVVDVNAESAGATQTDAHSDRVLQRINLAAVDEVARQIRLRNIGGIVVVDFIDLKDVGARRQVVERLRDAVSRDTAPVWVGSMSRLGLVELTRRRRGPTLTDAMMRRCTACDGTGRVARVRATPHSADEA